MVVDVVFYTKNSFILELVTSNRLALIPKSIKDKYKSFEFRIKVLDGCGDVELIDYAFNYISNSGCILILDTQVYSEKNLEGNEAWFLHVVDFNCENLTKNLLSGVLTKAIKAYAAYNKIFSDLSYQQILALPLNNFKSDELRCLVTQINQTPFNEPEVRKLLSQLNKRKIPKRTTRSRKKYLVDNEKIYFEYAKESHARVETGMPPHNKQCFLNGRFRFGVTISESQHYNITSEKQQVSKKFIDCHKQIHQVSCTHINMFSNGHIA